MNTSVRYQSQKGAALLAFIMVFLVFSSYSFIKKLNSNTVEHQRYASSLNALNKAKAALIGYAVNYPLNHAGVGPGRLPCPDTNNDGSAIGNCTGATTGRLPYKTLELEDLRDQSGQRLWYQVADNYRSYTVNPPAVNSDTAGNFSVDGDGDIVAVIFAPGVPVAAQDRAADALNVANYLEDDNADADNSFVTNNAAVEFNDTVVAITRQELMAAIEKRVLGDIDEALSNYQTVNNAYPWLSAFVDPSVSTYRGAINTWQGHLPFHWTADPESVAQGGAVAGRNPFTTDINIEWAIVNAAITSPGTTRYGTVSGYDIYDGSMVTPTIDCVENSTCVDGNYAGLSNAAPITFSNATCVWSNKETFQCTGSYINTIINNFPRQLLNVASFSFATGNDQWVFLRDTGVVVRGDGGPYCFCWQVNVHTQYAYTETITRTYTINITYTDTSANGADINPPTNINIRTRDLTINSADDAAALFAGNSTITITVEDDRQVSTPLDGGGTYTNVIPTSARVLTNDADTTGSITATGVMYDIDIDGYDGNGDGDYDDANEIQPEIPAWFVENGWHELMYLTYASDEPLPGDTTAGQDCNSLGTCLSININGSANNVVRAAALSAGIALAGQNRVATPDETDYFDNVENTDADEDFLKNRTTTTYNDQTRIISTAP